MRPCMCVSSCVRKYLKPKSLAQKLFILLILCVNLQDLPHSSTGTRTMCISIETLLRSYAVENLPNSYTYK